MLRSALALLLTTIVAPNAWSQIAPPASIPSGTYNLEITFGGGVMEGTLVVKTIGDSLAVQLNVGDHVSPVRAGERRSNRLVLESTSAAVPVRYELTFQKDSSVTGSFTYNGDSGSLTGRRRSGTGN